MSNLLPTSTGESSLELGVRPAALRLGSWLGWASLGVVALGVAVEGDARHRLLLVTLTLGAAAGNTLAMLVPWRSWLVERRGRVLLDLWCGGLIAFVALLVVDGGPGFALLLFLVVPFIAVVQEGRRRGVWLAAVLGTCTLVAVLVPLPAAATAMRAALVAASAAVALLVASVIRRETARAELAQTLAREASHRIKNDLQAAADVLLVRGGGGEGRALEEAAARIRSIAAVHRQLTQPGGRVDAASLLNDIAAGAPVPVTVEAERTPFDAATAQRLGLVANELVANAVRHGAPPIVVRLRSAATTRLTVEDSGRAVAGDHAPGVGLELVRRLVEHGLGGRLELHTASAGGTRAEVVFPAAGR
jgi:two-component sensor histidine kinase